MKKTAKFKIDDRVIVHDIEYAKHFKATIKSVKCVPPPSKSSREDDDEEDDDDSNNFSLETCAPFVASLLSQDAESNNDEGQQHQQHRLKDKVKEEEMQQQSSGWSYFVHFIGWNARYRKWMSEELIFEENVESLQLLDVKYSGSGQIRVVTKGNNKTKNKSNNNSDQPQQLLNDDTSTFNHASSNVEDMQKLSSNDPRPRYEKYQFTGTLPDKLYDILTKERSHIIESKHNVNNTFSYQNNRNKRKRGVEYVLLHKLPSKITISTMIQQFLDYINNNDNNEHHLDHFIISENEEELNWNKFTKQIKLLFNKSLSKLLLYPTERKQHTTILSSSNNDNGDLCETYGCEYLLRFFIRLDALIKAILPIPSPPSSKKDQELIFRYQLYSLLQYLNQFSDKYFLNEYAVTEYEMD